MRKIWLFLSIIFAMLTVSCAFMNNDIETGSLTFSFQNSYRARKLADDTEEKILVKLKGDVNLEKEIVRGSSSSITFDEIAEGSKITAEAYVYSQSGKAKEYIYTGKSVEITIEEGNNTAEINLKNVEDYKISFNANGGKFAEGKTTLEGYSSISETAKLSKFGYTLNGWATAKDGKKAYESDLSDFVPIENATLYALYEQKYPYMVFIDANGGKFTSDEIDNCDGQTYTGQDKEPSISDLVKWATLKDTYKGKLVKDGYELKGFAAKGTTEVLNAKTGTAALSELKKNKVITLYAVWSATGTSSNEAESGNQSGESGKPVYTDGLTLNFDMIADSSYYVVDFTDSSIEDFTQTAHHCDQIHFSATKFNGKTSVSFTMKVYADSTKAKLLYQTTAAVSATLATTGVKEVSVTLTKVSEEQEVPSEEPAEDPPAEEEPAGDGSEKTFTINFERAISESLYYVVEGYNSEGRSIGTASTQTPSATSPAANISKIECSFGSWSDIYFDVRAYADDTNETLKYLTEERIHVNLTDSTPVDVSLVSEGALVTFSTVQNGETNEVYYVATLDGSEITGTAKNLCELYLPATAFGGATTRTFSLKVYTDSTKASLICATQTDKTITLTGSSVPKERIELTAAADLKTERPLTINLGQTISSGYAVLTYFDTNGMYEETKEVSNASSINVSPLLKDSAFYFSLLIYSDSNKDTLIYRSDEIQVGESEAEKTVTLQTGGVLVNFQTEEPYIDRTNVYYTITFKDSTGSTIYSDERTGRNTPNMYFQSDSFGSATTVNLTVKVYSDAERTTAIRQSQATESITLSSTSIGAITVRWTDQITPDDVDPPEGVTVIRSDAAEADTPSYTDGLSLTISGVQSGNLYYVVTISKVDDNGSELDRTTTKFNATMCKLIHFSPTYLTSKGLETGNNIKISVVVYTDSSESSGILESTEKESFTLTDSLNTQTIAWQ